MRKLCLVVLSLGTIPLCSGCLCSLGHHCDVLLGNCYPEPFPMIRYWGDYSKEEFFWDVVEAPFVGFPGVVPIGYSLDVVTDFIFFPLDVALWVFIEEPKWKVEENPEGKGYVLVSGKRSELKKGTPEELRGTFPLFVKVTQGALNVWAHRPGFPQELVLRIEPQSIQFHQSDGMLQVKKVKFNEGQIILVVPPWRSLPSPFPMIWMGYTEEKDVSLYLTLQGISSSRGIGAHINWESGMTLVLVPTEDFQGEAMVDGISISHIIFK